MYQEKKLSLDRSWEDTRQIYVKIESIIIRRLNYMNGFSIWIMIRIKKTLFSSREFFFHSFSFEFDFYDFHCHQLLTTSFIVISCSSK